MDIVRKRLDASQYYSGEHTKTQIYLHHTVSSTVDSTYKWWQQTPEHVGTAYIIDKDGTIYEVFSPKKWAYHLGLSVSAYEKKSIGIELVNESYLWFRNPEGYYWLDNKVKYNDSVHVQEWRGHKYWAAYPDEQFFATVDLVKHLTDKFNIKKQVITHHEYDASLAKNYEGVLSHCNVRSDKTDVSVAFDLELFKKLTFPEAVPIDVSDMKPIE